MDTSDRNGLGGMFEERRGRVKEILGDLRDDEQREADGKSDQASGDLKQNPPHLKDKVPDTIKKATS